MPATRLPVAGEDSQVPMSTLPSPGKIGQAEFRGTHEQQRWQGCAKTSSRFWCFSLQHPLPFKMAWVRIEPYPLLTVLAMALMANRVTGWTATAAVGSHGRKRGEERACVNVGVWRGVQPTRSAAAGDGGGGITRSHCRFLIYRI